MAGVSWLSVSMAFRALLSRRLAFGRTPSEIVREGVAFRHEAHGDRIHAVALARGRRPVGKHMAEVALAAGAADLGADHAVAGVPHEGDMGAVDRIEEARPAGAG